MSSASTGVAGRRGGVGPGAIDQKPAMPWPCGDCAWTLRVEKPAAHAASAQTTFKAGMSVVRSGRYSDLGSVFAERARDPHQITAVLRRHAFELDLVAGREAFLAPAAAARDRRRRGLGRPLLLLAVRGDDVELQDRVRVVEAKLRDGAADGDPLVDLVEHRRRVMRERRTGTENEHGRKNESRDHALFLSGRRP